VTVADALRGVTKIGLDTAPVIYFVEANRAYVDVCRAVFAPIANGTLAAVTSAVTLTETLVSPLRTQNAVLETEYRDLLLNTNGVTLLPVDVAVAERPADLRARYNLKTPDALQVATALENGCQAFLTNDAGLRRVAAEIGILVLGELTA
jgi:predicted nucleic acid-binding protein